MRSNQNMQLDMHYTSSPSPCCLLVFKCSKTKVRRCAATPLSSRASVTHTQEHLEGDDGLECHSVVALEGTRTARRRCMAAASFAAVSESLQRQPDW